MVTSWGRYVHHLHVYQATDVTLPFLDCGDTLFDCSCYLVFLLLKRTHRGPGSQSDLHLSGLSMVIQNVLLMVFKSGLTAPSALFSRTISRSETLSHQRRPACLFDSDCDYRGLLWFLNKTDTGRAMKAVSQDRSAAL